MNTQAYIVIKNCTREELKTMLNDWLIMYAARLRSKMTFEMAEFNPNTFILKMDKSLDDTDFFYMVNYFSYPIGFNKTFEAEGYATATKHKRLLNKNIYVFINRDDKEYDNVWMTTEDGETYKFDFDGKFKKIYSENNYKTWNTISLPTTYEQINVDKKELLKEAKRREEERSRRSVAKRFKVISTLLFVLIPIVYIVNSYFPYVAHDLLVYISSLIVAIWFVSDYEIFGNKKRTIICVLLSLLNFSFGITPQDLPANRQELTAVLVTLPLSSIIVMLTANKVLGTKIGIILDSWLNKLFIMALLSVSLLISLSVFNTILKFLE